MPEIALGNDVVDLGDPEADPGALHPGFDARVMTRAERSALSIASNPHAVRWRLWALKEASYKALRRLRPVVFSPRRIEIVEPGALAGRSEHAVEIRFGGSTLRGRVATVGVAVHAWVFAGLADSEIVTGCARIEPHGDASEVVRQHARRALVRAGFREASIGREGRLPVHLEAGRLTETPLSLSHHGRFAAWALAPSRSGVLAA